MPKTRRIFLSDIHLTSQKLYDDPKKRSWFKPLEHEPRLLAFLDNYVLTNKEQIKDVVLLGDVFNTWVCPARDVPPTYREIFSANKAILAKLKDIIKAGMALFFVNGNHDFDLQGPVLHKAIRGVQVIKYYLTGRIHAEHGHRFDIYNKPDFATDPAYGRPIGYFISRLVTSINGQDFGILDLPGYLDDIIEAALTSQNIFSSIIEGLAEKAGMTDSDEIKLPNKQSISIGALKDRFQRLNGVYSKTELINDLYQRRYLNGPADRLCQLHDFNVIVFGHTHNALIDKDFFLVEDRIYANTGSWAKDHAYCVEIDKSQDPASPTKVHLHRVNKTGSIECTETKEV